MKQINKYYSGLNTKESFCFLVFKNNKRNYRIDIHFNNYDSGLNRENYYSIIDIFSNCYVVYRKQIKPISKTYITKEDFKPIIKEIETIIKEL